MGLRIKLEADDGVGHDGAGWDYVSTLGHWDHKKHQYYYERLIQFDEITFGISTIFGGFWAPKFGNFVIARNDEKTPIRYRKIEIYICFDHDKDHPLEYCTNVQRVFAGYAWLTSISNEQLTYQIYQQAHDDVVVLDSSSGADQGWTGTVPENIQDIIERISIIDSCDISNANGDSSFTGLYYIDEQLNCLTLAESMAEFWAHYFYFDEDAGKAYLLDMDSHLRERVLEPHEVGDDSTSADPKIYMEMPIYELKASYRNLSGSHPWEAVAYNTVYDIGEKTSVESLEQAKERCEEALERRIEISNLPRGKLMIPIINLGGQVLPGDQFIWNDERADSRWLRVTINARNVSYSFDDGYGRAYVSGDCAYEKWSAPAGGGGVQIL